MIVLGLDPGLEKSALVLFDGTEVGFHSVLGNEELLSELHGDRWQYARGGKLVLVIEQIESFGMAVGRETFETVYWTGRFAEAWVSAQGRRVDRTPRRIIKAHLCHSNRATDANIRQALIDRFGPTLEKAIGNKKTPGPLYGIKSHEWAALAVAVTWHDQHGSEDLVRPGLAAQW